MGCVSLERCSHNLVFGKAEGQTVRIDLALAELLKLRGALCKMNLILSSLRLSMGGVDPLIDD